MPSGYGRASQSRDRKERFFKALPIARPRVNPPAVVTWLSRDRRERMRNMSRHKDSGRFDLAEVFRRVQHQMLAHLDLAGLFEHPTSSGAATEQQWIKLFELYLPQRYRAAPAFVIDSAGRRSRQIDLAVFDNLYSPLLFPHSAGLHIPAESIYAVFEIKPSFTRQLVRDAHIKAASVRALTRSSRTRPPHILAGLLATRSLWTPDTFAPNLRSALDAVGNSLDLGCCLALGSFEYRRRAVRISDPAESLIFFVIRLIERLRALSPAPAADWTLYARNLRSFQR